MVERARLESVYTPKGYRGFESLPLRLRPPKRATADEIASSSRRRAIASVAKGIINLKPDEKYKLHRAFSILAPDVVLRLYP